MSLNFCNNNSLSAITALPASISGGGLNLISTQTASSSSTLDFTSGLDSTYKEYIFKFINVHPETDNVRFQINFRDGGTDFDATKTTTHFEAYHNESNSSDVGLQYVTSADLAQSTSPQHFGFSLGNANDESVSGTLHLFDPSNTTAIKHFISTVNFTYYTGFCMTQYIAGYCNTITAIDGVQFSMTSNSIESGIVKLYGVS